MPVPGCARYVGARGLARHKLGRSDSGISSIHSMSPGTPSYRGQGYLIFSPLCLEMLGNLLVAHRKINSEQDMTVLQVALHITKTTAPYRHCQMPPS